MHSVGGEMVQGFGEEQNQDQDQDQNQNQNQDQDQNQNQNQNQGKERVERGILREVGEDGTGDTPLIIPTSASSSSSASSSASASGAAALSSSSAAWDEDRCLFGLPAAYDYWSLFAFFTVMQAPILLKSAPELITL